MEIPITVEVKTITGKTISVEMALSNTIADLKKKVKKLQGPEHGTSEDLELHFDEGEEELKDTAMIGDILGHRIFDMLGMLLAPALATQHYSRRSRSRERSRSRDRK